MEQNLKNITYNDFIKWVQEQLQTNKFLSSLVDNSADNHDDTNCVPMDIVNHPFKTVNTINVIIVRINTSALIDTSATCSLIKYEFYKQIVHSNDKLDLIEAENIRINTAENKPLRIRGRFHTNI